MNELKKLVDEICLELKEISNLYKDKTKKTNETIKWINEANERLLEQIKNHRE